MAEENLELQALSGKLQANWDSLEDACPQGGHKGDFEIRIYFQNKPISLDLTDGFAFTPQTFIQS